MQRRIEPELLKNAWAVKVTKYVQSSLNFQPGPSKRQIAELNPVESNRSSSKYVLENFSTLFPERPWRGFYIEALAACCPQKRMGWRTSGQVDSFRRCFHGFLHLKKSWGSRCSGHNHGDPFFNQCHNECHCDVFCSLLHVASRLSGFKSWANSECFVVLVWNFGMYKL